MESAVSNVDDDLINLERMIVRIQDMNVDSAAVKSQLAELRCRCTTMRDDGLSKLSELMTAISSTLECEREHEAVLKSMKDAENRLQALLSDGSLSVEDKYQQQEVQVFTWVTSISDRLFIRSLTAAS